jgi:hypothetical protein
MYQGDALPAMLILRPIVCVASSILASPRSDNANRYPPPSSETIRSEHQRLLSVGASPVI